MRLSKPCDVSLIVIRIRSPWFISSVWLFGVKLASFRSAGPAGPVGMPSFWMNAKLVGSMQLGLQNENSEVHSRLLMCNEAHQCFVSQLTALMNGGIPG